MNECKTKKERRIEERKLIERKLRKKTKETIEVR